MKIPTSTSMAGAATFTVKVQPRSSKTEVTGFLDDGTVKIRLNAPPVEGKANDALIHYLANILDVRRSAIEIKSGELSRTKVVRIVGLDQEAALKAFRMIISG